MCINKSRSLEINGAGGVAILINNKEQFSRCDIFDSLNYEVCAIYCYIKNKEYLIVAYYNPPDIDLSEEIFKILSYSNKEVILLGDLNAKSTA